MEQSQPSTSEISRRVTDLKVTLEKRLSVIEDNLQRGNDSINSRIDNLPSKDLLLAMLERFETQLRVVEDDVKEEKTARLELEKKVDIGQRDAQAYTDHKVSGLEKKILEAKRWAIGTAITLGGLVVSVFALVRTLIQ